MAPDEVSVFAICQGRRIEGVFDRATNTLRVTSGPRAGTRFTSPSAAAQAVVAGINPEVTSNRNGWTFWKISDSKRELATLK